MMAGSLAPSPLPVTPLTPEKLEHDRQVQVAHDAARAVYVRSGCGARLVELTAQASLQNRIPASIIAAVVVTESRCNSNAVSPDGASIGLMQIIPYWHHVSKKKLLNPEVNIRVGSRYLGGCIHRWGLHEGLAHYNGSVESEQYADHVLSVAARGEKQ